MSRKPNYFWIGALTLMAFVILGIVLVIFGGGDLLRPKMFLETYVNGTVQGVDVGSPVKFRGVQIGRVTSIGFTMNEYPHQTDDGLYNYVLINMVVDKEVFPGMFEEDMHGLLKENVERGLRARIEPQGITGMNYIDIDYLSDPNRFPLLKFDWKPRNYYIPSVPGQLTSLLDSVNAILRQVQELKLDVLGDDAGSLLANLNKAVTQSNIPLLIQKLEGLTDRLDKAIADANLPGLSKDTQSLVKNLESSNARLEKILKNLEPATRLNPKEIQAIISNINAASASLKTAAQEISDNPAVLFWGEHKRKKKVEERR